MATNLAGPLVPSRPWRAARLGRPGLARPLAGAALVASVGTLVLLAVLWPDRFNMIDLQVYRAGGAAVLHGQPLYSAHPAGSQLPFTYPPFAALLFAPFAAVAWPVAQIAVALAWLACLGAVLVMCLEQVGYRPPGRVAGPAGVRAGTVGRGGLAAGWARRVGPGRPVGAVGRSGWADWMRSPVLLVAVAAAAWLEPVRGTLGFGQVNLLLVALVLADFTGRCPRLPRGVLIGVAAGLKLTPGIFAVYLLVTGRRRAAATAFGAFLGTAAVGRLVLPEASAKYWAKLWLNPEHVGGVAYAGNQSLYGTASRLLQGVHQGGLWLPAALLVGCSGLYAAAAAYRAGQELTGVSVCALTGLLLSPISWSHHWVWVLPGTVVAVAAALRRPTGARLARLAGWLAVFALGPIWWVPHGGDIEYREHGVQLLLGNAYLLAGLAALALAAARAGQRRRDTVPAGAVPAGAVPAGAAQAAGVPSAGVVGAIPAAGVLSAGVLSAGVVGGVPAAGVAGGGPAGGVDQGSGRRP
ncbi:MAG TPA: glycosyltransferase 87 family protein [Mycobacteriales bacterium]|nr:glycosyltransferase 87 family protein [Mycobacteriales bacterium]